jgi:hypothetical protein
MAGARPSSFKRGGGFLNDVDAVWTDYEFTDVFPFQSEDRPRKKSKDPDFRPLYALLTFQVDGADEPVQTTRFVGSADDFEIEDDGKTLVPANEDVALRASAEFSLFIQTLVEAGFPEDRLSEEAINFESVLGTRLRLAQRTNDEKTKKLGPRVDKKTKKSYAWTDLVVEAVYDLPGKGKAVGRPAGPGKAGAGGSKGKGASAPGAKKTSADVDYTEEATDVLLTILAERSPIAKGKLRVPVLKALTGKPADERDGIYKALFDEDFLASEQGWTYDADAEELALAE